MALLPTQEGEGAPKEEVPVKPAKPAWNKPSAGAAAVPVVAATAAWPTLLDAKTEPKKKGAAALDAEPEMKEPVRVRSLQLHVPFPFFLC